MKIMDKRISKYYFCTHTVFVGVVCFWYLLSDVYFGYGFVDQIIFLAIVFTFFLSLILSIRFNKINDNAVFYLVSAALFDVWLFYLILNRYW